VCAWVYIIQKGVSTTLSPLSERERERERERGGEREREVGGLGFIFFEGKKKRPIESQPEGP